MERPLLTPQNRRIRHLKGVCVRNITFSPLLEHTIDDVALNKSPSKLETLSEFQSFTTDDLPRPRPGQLRRKSTNWSGQSPGYRQKKLETVIENGTADTFFTLHWKDADAPVYISEVVAKAMNPTFRDFDLSDHGPAIRRQSHFRIKLWAKRQSYELFLDEKVDMSKLAFLGKLENHPFPHNCLLFQLVDGIYSMGLPSNYPPPKAMPSLTTSSYNALLRLAGLDESIQDALATRESIARQMEELLINARDDDSAQAEESAARANGFVVSSRKSLKTSSKYRSVLLSRNQERRTQMEQGRQAVIKTEEDMKHARERLQQDRAQMYITGDNIHGQRRRICEELLRIFPIEPTTTPLLFTICGLILPNTSFDDSNTDSDDLYSAALGLVARLVDILQYYLFVPLPYPVTAYGSRSIIQDPISVLPDSQRTFPLYTKGTVRYRFDYAVFLLNKNIERLTESQGCKVIDIRHTLPNLKFLLFIGSAGAGELPSRKAGGIRGLLTGRTGVQSVPISRAVSDDATANGNGGAALKNQIRAQTQGKEDAAKKDELLTGLPLKGFSGSLRTKGMREGVTR